MDARVLDLVNKLQHELPEVRDRSVSSLHSKVVVSGLVAASSFPADDLAVALLCFLQARPTSSSLPKALRLILELAQNHSSGAVALNRRGAVRILEKMDTPGPCVGSPSDPRALAELLRSKHPDVLPCPPSALPLPENAPTQLQRDASSHRSGRLSSPVVPASPSPSLAMARPQNSVLFSAASSSPAAVPAPRGAYDNRVNEIWSPPLSPRAPTSTPDSSLPATVSNRPPALTSTSTAPVPTSAHSSSTLSANPAPPTSAYGATSESWAAAATSNPWAVCAYHDGWRPSVLPIDGADIRRIVEVEAGLAQGRDARARAAAANSLAALCRDMPIDALLARPPALHALVAAFTAPLCELASSSSSSSSSLVESGKSGADRRAATTPPPQRVFGHLLEALVDALEECVAALKRTKENHFNASLIGGAAAAAATQAAQAALHTDAAERVSEASSGELQQAALWSPVRMRCPSPRTPHHADLDFTFAARAAAAASAGAAARGNSGNATADHCFGEDAEPPSSATPLSLGGAALLLLRLALDLVATATGATAPSGTCAATRRPAGHQGLASKGFKLIAQLLPLLAEPTLQSNQEDHGDASATAAPRSMEEYRRAVVVARTQAVLQAWVQTLEATGVSLMCASSSGDNCDQEGDGNNVKGRRASLLLGDLAQESTRANGGGAACGVGIAPLLLALPKLLAGPHATVALEWLRGTDAGSTGDDSEDKKNTESWAFVTVQPLVADTLETLACSAVLASCRPRVHALAGAALAGVCPDASVHLQQASERARATAPLAKQLFLGDSGADSSTSDEGVDSWAANGTNELVETAAVQVASPSAAGAWLEEALHQISQVASDLAGVLNQGDARALADLAVLLWGFTASEPLALALVQPACNSPHDRTRASSTSTMAHIVSTWSSYRAAAESLLLGILAEPCFTTPILNALAGLLGISNGNISSSGNSGSLRPFAKAARALGLQKLGLMLQCTYGAEQDGQQGGITSPAEAACEALMTSEVGRSLLLRCASFADSSLGCAKAAAAAASVVCALAEAAATSPTALSSTPNAPLFQVCTRSGLLDSLQVEKAKTAAGADNLIVGAFCGSTKTSRSSVAWRDLFHREASVRRSALAHLLADGEEVPPSVDPWASSPAIHAQGDDLMAALRSFAANDIKSSSSGNCDGTGLSSGPTGSVLGKLQRAGGPVGSNSNNTNRPAFGAGDAAALAGLIADRGLSPQTRAAAANQLAAVLGASLLKPTQPHEGDDERESVPLSAPGAAITVARASLLECVNGLQDGTNKEGVVQLTPDWEGPCAALDLLLVLLWAQPSEVRPMLLQPFCSNEHPTAIYGHASDATSDGSDNKSSALATVVLPWLRAAGSPQPALRTAASSAALIVWRCCFDPLDFAVNPTGNCTGECRGCAVYPPALLASFPPPPLGPLTKLAKVAPHSCSNGSDNKGSTQLLPGLLEAQTNSGVEVSDGAISNRESPLRPAAAAYLATTLYSLLYPTDPFMKALVTVEEEDGASGDSECTEDWAKARAVRIRSDAAVYRWLSPRAAAHALRVAMTSAQSHAALSACLDSAAAWVAADQRSGRGNSSGSTSRKGGSDAGGYNDEGRITFVMAFAQVSSSSVATHAAMSSDGLQSPPAWDKALAPLLAQPPAAPRDRQVLLAAMPLLRALAQRGLGPSGRRKLAVCACSALVPLLTQDAEQRSGKSEASATGSNRNRTPNNSLGVGRGSPIDLSATTTAASPSQPQPWEPLPPWSPVRSNNTSFNSSTRSFTPGMESFGGGGARGPSRTVAVLQVQVLGLLADLIDPDESFALGAPSHMDEECDGLAPNASSSGASGGVCSVLSGCASLFSALANLLLRRTPSSYLAPSPQGHDAACVPSVALQFLGCFARSATRLASNLPSAAHSGSSKASSSASGLGSGATNVWIRVLPDLLRGSLALAGVPRLPDTFAHKQLARPALAAARALAHLDAQLHGQRQQQLQQQASQTQQASALQSPALISLGPKLVLGWCRRLSVDREASVRAAAFGLLGHTWALPHWWSHSQSPSSLSSADGGVSEERGRRGGEVHGEDEGQLGSGAGSPGGWSRHDAIRACVRAFCDPSEAPVVRAEGATALAAAVASASNISSSESSEAGEASWSALESSRSGDSLDPSSESGVRFEPSTGHRRHGVFINEEDKGSLARGLNACVSAVAASPYDGSALSPCFTASAAQLLAAAASAHANFVLGGANTCGASPTVPAVCLVDASFAPSTGGDPEASRDKFARHFGGACLAVAAWADATHLTALNACAASRAQAGACFESTATGGLPWPGADPHSCRAAAGVAMRALRSMLAAARSVGGTAAVGNAGSSSSPINNLEALRSALLRSSYILSTLLRALTAADDNGDDGATTHFGQGVRTKTAVAPQASATRWVEAAELLTDLFVEDSNAAALLGRNCHTSATPPALALALAHAIDHNTHLHSDQDDDDHDGDDHQDFNTEINRMNGSAPGCGYLSGKLSERVRFSALRLAVATLQAPGWGASAASHSRAAPQLWCALVRARLSLTTTTTSSTSSRQSSVGVVAPVAASGAAAAEASLLAHAALAALAAQAPEALVGAAGIESLAVAVTSEVSTLANTATAALGSGDSTSSGSGTPAIGAAPVVVALQARLGLLRCLSSQGLSSACAGDLGRLLDRAWPALAALGNHAPAAHAHRGSGAPAATADPPMTPAAASPAEPSCLSVPCLALLADALGSLAHASPQHATMLCSPPPRPDGHAGTSSAGSVVSSSSSSSSSTATGRGPGAQGIVAKRLLVAALSGSGASSSASSYGGLPPAAVVAGTRALVPFMACAEGRALLLQHSGIAQLVSVLNSALGAPRRRRQAAGERAVAVLRLLVTATLHEDLQRALLQVPEFADFLNGAMELFEAFDKEHGDRHMVVAGSAAAQPTARHAAAATPPAPNAANVRGIGWRDPMASPGVRELCALLVRNLARHRTSHKGRLVASPGVLRFLLRSLCPRDTTAATPSSPHQHHSSTLSEDGVPLRVAAACSAALWSLLHHSAKAAPALRQLQADVPVGAALQRAQHALPRQSTIAAPSVQRTAHHLSMVQLLLAKSDADS